MSALILDAVKKAALDAGFAASFGGAPERYFSAPGRTEISGNHTSTSGAGSWPVRWIWTPWPRCGSTAPTRSASSPRATPCAG